MFTDAKHNHDPCVEEIFRLTAIRFLINESPGRSAILAILLNCPQVPISIYALNITILIIHRFGAELGQVIAQFKNQK